MKDRYKSTKVLNSIFNTYKFNNNIKFKWHNGNIIRHCDICGEDIVCNKLSGWDKCGIKYFLTIPKNVYCSKCNKNKLSKDELKNKIENTYNYYLLESCTNNSMTTTDIKDLLYFGINEEIAGYMVKNHAVFNGYLLYYEKKRLEDFVEV